MILSDASMRNVNGDGARKDQVLRPLTQRLFLALAMVVLAAAGLLAPALAQTRLEAHYSATIAGIPIGTGSWVIDITDTQYSAAVNGQTSGLLRAFTGGQGNATVRGTLNGGRTLSSIYTATISGRGKRLDSIRIAISNGNVKEYKVDPPAEDDPARVPITEASQRGVLDPMTASMVRMPGGGDPLVPEACQRTHEVFDGRLRYDMQFAFKRMEKVKAAKGYSGPVVVCAAYFTPVAGFVPTSNGDQISRQATRHGGLACARRRNPCLGAYSRARTDAYRPGGARRFGVRCDPDPGRGQRHEDAVGRAS